jgi:hypothetical protein
MVGGVQPSVPTKQPVALGFNIGSGMASVAWLSRVTGASNSELQPAPKPQLCSLLLVPLELQATGRSSQVNQNGKLTLPALIKCRLWHGDMAIQ